MTSEMPIRCPSGLYERIAIPNEVVVLLLGQPEHSGDIWIMVKGRSFLKAFVLIFVMVDIVFKYFSLLWTAYLIQRDRGFCNGRSLILKLTRDCILYMDLEAVLRGVDETVEGLNKKLGEGITRERDERQICESYGLPVI